MGVLKWTPSCAPILASKHRNMTTRATSPSRGNGQFYALISHFAINVLTDNTEVFKYVHLQFLVHNLGLWAE
ncbi:unnamed protein product [Calypogeia fissa]